MPILITILGIIAGAGFWWFRMKNAGQAAGEIIDTAQRIKGHVKRKNFRTKAGQSSFAAIDDPVIGAATIILAIAEDCDAADPALASRLQQALVPVSNAEAAEEAVIYGQWAVKDTAEATSAIRIISPLINDRLSVNEREQFVLLAQSVVAGGAHNASALKLAIKSLRQKLSLVVE